MSDTPYAPTKGTAILASFITVAIATVMQLVADPQGVWIMAALAAGAFIWTASDLRYVMRRWKYLFTLSLLIIMSLCIAPVFGRSQSLLVTGHLSYAVWAVILLHLSKRETQGT